MLPLLILLLYVLLTDSFPITRRRRDGTVEERSPPSPVCVCVGEGGRWSSTGNISLFSIAGDDFLLVAVMVATLEAAIVVSGGGGGNRGER